MRNLTEPLWNFSSAPCGRCLTRSLKLPRPAARVTPELWFFAGLPPLLHAAPSKETCQVGPISRPCVSRRGTGREAFHEATQNRAATRPFVIGNGASYCQRVRRKGRSPDGCKNQLLGEGVENCAHRNALALQEGRNDQAIRRGARTIPQRASKSKSLIGKSQ